MGKRHHPTRGSHGFSPRVRQVTPHISAWPEPADGPKIQGFVGYKAGMTHAFVIDNRKHSTTAGQEIRVPVTVLEVPPMRVAAVRLYRATPYGLCSVFELWAEQKGEDKETKGSAEEKKEIKAGLSEELRRLFPMPKNYDFKAASEKLDTISADEVRIVAHTQPSLITGVPTKCPELVELRIGGGTIADRKAFARSLLGKEIKISDFTAEGSLVDVVSITKGKGFQGHIKRWGVKLQPHKNSKHRRMIGTLGPHFPSYVAPTVPQAGQVGTHQRTEYNKRVLKIGDNGEEITPAGGFLNYGIVRNQYILLYGSIPGCAKRLVKLRDPIRPHEPRVSKYDITYISTESKQGR